MKPIAPVVRLALCALAVCPLLVRADLPGNIVVRSMASRIYAHSVSAGTNPRPATYLFFQGRFFRGATNDPSLQETSFAAITRTLAPDLARQGFFPTRDLRGANLLIVVDWGATIGQDNPYLLQEQQTFNDSVAAYRSAALSGQTGNAIEGADFTSVLASDEIFKLEDISADISMMGTARLLGIKDQFEHAIKASKVDTNGKSYVEAAIDDELRQDRYFLIVTAYDYQALRKSGKVGRPVWTTRINMPAEAMAFAEALPAMSHAAANSYGTSNRARPDRIR
jgi:hypothetical protein